MHDYRELHDPKREDGLGLTAAREGCNPSDRLIQLRRRQRRQNLRTANSQLSVRPRSTGEILTCVWKARFGESVGSVGPVEMLGVWCAEVGDWGGDFH